MFGLFSIFSCNAQNKKAQPAVEHKLQVATIFTKPERKVITDPETNSNRTLNTYTAVTERLAHKIKIQSQAKNYLTYSLEGNISSGGLTINKVKKIRIEKTVLNDTLFIKNIVEIIRIAGKESAIINGYNYKKTEQLEIESHIKIVQIELVEDYLNNPNKTASKVVESWSI